MEWTPWKSQEEGRASTGKSKVLNPKIIWMDLLFCWDSWGRGVEWDLGEPGVPYV